MSSAVIATAFYRKPTGGYSAFLSSVEFSLQVPGRKLHVFKHDNGRNLEVENLSVTDNGPLKIKLLRKTTAP